MNNQRTAVFLLFVSLVTAVLAVTGGIFEPARSGSVKAMPAAASFPKPYRVKDINRRTFTSMIHCPVVLGEAMFCSARDQDHGFELWKSDGNWNGATLIKDIAPGPGDSYALNGSYAQLNNEILFSTTGTTTELWKTNGTSEGTKLVKGDFHSFSENKFVTGKNLVYFTARRDGPGLALWRSDGSTDGTFALRDENTGNYGDARLLTPLGDKIYFTANNDQQLWTSDGTLSGTKTILSYEDPMYFLGIYSLIDVEDFLLLNMMGMPEHDQAAIWRMDSATHDFELVIDLGPRKYVVPVQFSRLESGVLFMYHDQDTGSYGLGLTDGTAEGTKTLDGIGFSGSGINDMFSTGKQAFFTLEEKTLWRTDGTSEGTYPLHTFEEWDPHSCPENFLAFESDIYFAADDGVHGCELWFSDGTVAGTYMVADVWPGDQGFRPIPGVSFNDYLYFSATDGSGDTELWRTDGTESGTQLADDVVKSPTDSSFPIHLTAREEGVYLGAFNGTEVGLWRSSGTAGDTLPVKLFESREFESPFAYEPWAMVNDMLYFIANYALWRSDGTETGTVQVNSPEECEQPYLTTAVGADLYFFAEARGNHLCKAGDPSILIMEADGGEAVAGDSLLFFRTGNGKIGVSDGTPAGSKILVSPIATGYMAMATIGDTLFFTGCEGEYGEGDCELWKLVGQGTPERVADIKPGTASSTPRYLVTYGNHVFFTAESGAPGRMLWKSDGSEAGTVPVAPVNMCIEPDLGDFTSAVWNGRLYFPAYADGKGCELWSTDGTTEGTGLVKDIVDGPNHSFPEQLTSSDDYLFFTANDGVHDRELWVSDGTAEGTFMVEDLYPQDGEPTNQCGPEFYGSCPSELTFSDGRLYFRTHDAQNDVELWALCNVEEPPTADFLASPSTGIAPFSVSFENHSSCSPDACTWDFGDGSTSDGCTDQQHEYKSSGKYTVSLTVKGTGGEGMKTVVEAIAVFKPSVSDFSVSPSTGPLPLEVKFTNLSSGDFEHCTWYFGDGSKVKSCDDQSTIFSRPGIYTPSLLVGGPGGNNRQSLANAIMVYEPVTADFSASPTSGFPPLSVSFKNLSSGDYDSCTWSFGDGANSNDCKDPSHSYLSPGKFQVSLTVSGLGGEDTETKKDYISVENYRIFLPCVSGK
jgi:ELWxxDGT repeat protein